VTTAREAPTVDGSRDSTTTEIRVSVTFSGTFDVDAVAAAMPVAATNTWHTGDPMRAPGKVRPNDGCAYELPKMSCEVLEDRVGALLAVFAGHAEALRALREKYRFAVDIACAVTIDPDTTTPAMSFSVEMLQSIASLGASLDIDLYVR
jgi:hypothetical protein